MDPTVRIVFTVDEHLPRRQVGRILGRHLMQVADLGTKDPAILDEAEGDGAIILSADRWFDDQLRRIPSRDKGIYKRAGVVRIPGSWVDARRWLPRCLPVIETVFQMTRGEDDKRVVMHIHDNGALYIEP